MSGGMYAVSRKWFNHLGGYDIGMDMWGAENLEMSFRVSSDEMITSISSSEPTAFICHLEEAQHLDILS